MFIAYAADNGTKAYPIIPLSSRSRIIWPNGPFKTELLVPVLPDRQYRVQVEVHPDDFKTHPPPPHSPPSPATFQYKYRNSPSFLRRAVNFLKPLVPRSQVRGTGNYILDFRNN